MYNQHVGFLAGLSYEQYNWIQGSNNRVRQTFVCVPISFQYIAAQSGKAGFFVQTGLNLMASLSDRFNSPNIGQIGSFYPNWTGIQLGFKGFAGICFPVSKNIEMLAGPACNINVTNNYKDDASAYLSQFGIKFGIVLQP